MTPADIALVARLHNPPFGTETSERNLMSEAAARITTLAAENAAQAARIAALEGLARAAQVLISKLDAFAAKKLVSDLQFPFDESGRPQFDDYEEAVHAAYAVEAYGIANWLRHIAGDTRAALAAEADHQARYAAQGEA